MSAAPGWDEDRARAIVEGLAGLEGATLPILICVALVPPLLLALLGVVYLR